MNNTVKTVEEDDGFTEELFNRLERHSDDTNSFISGGIKVPELPKPGEAIICQFCGKPIYSDEFSEDPFQRKFEFKWHLHPKCKKAMEEQADRFTPGLIAERKKAMGEYNQRITQKVSTPQDRGVVSRNNKRITPIKEFGKKIQKKNV